jgi:hypothetical protein
MVKSASGARLIQRPPVALCTGWGSSPTSRPACTTCLRLRLDLMVGGQDLVSPGEQGTPLGLTLRLVLAPRQEYLEVSR